MVLFSEVIRNLCIKNGWFNKGSNLEYQMMLYAANGAGDLLIDYEFEFSTLSKYCEMFAKIIDEHTSYEYLKIYDGILFGEDVIKRELMKELLKYKKFNVLIAKIAREDRTVVQREAVYVDTRQLSTKDTLSVKDWVEESIGNRVCVYRIERDTDGVGLINALNKDMSKGTEGKEGEFIILVDRGDQEGECDYIALVGFVKGSEKQERIEDFLYSK